MNLNKPRCVDILKIDDYYTPKHNRDRETRKSRYINTHFALFRLCWGEVILFLKWCCGYK